VSQQAGGLLGGPGARLKHVTHRSARRRGTERRGAAEPLEAWIN